MFIKLVGSFSSKPLPTFQQKKNVLVTRYLLMGEQNSDYDYNYGIEIYILTVAIAWIKCLKSQNCMK